MERSYKTEAIVIKRTNYAEADRIVTLFTKDYGKVSVLAKGVRKIVSKRAASIEIGTQLKAMIFRGKGIDILAQTNMIDSFPEVKKDLVSCTQLYQLLEVVDMLTREEQELPEVYDVIVGTLNVMKTTANRKQLLLVAFKRLAELLGFVPPTDISEITLKSYIETIAERKLKSKDYFTVKTI